MAKLQRVLIVAGGTGGHVYPGLAVAHALQVEGVDVCWLGVREGFEARVVADHGICFKNIAIGGWRGKGWRVWLKAPFLLARAVWQAMRVIRAYQPDVVLGMGGFVSGPCGIASVLLRYPLVIHEQNAIPGMTNRWLSFVAKSVMQAFPDTFSKDAFTTGNPVRVDILAVGNAFDQKKWPEGRRLHLLVLGGSLGAAPINQLLPEAISALPENLRPEIWHQSGEKHVLTARQAFEKWGVEANVVPFIQDMSAAYSWADMVLCRAGALTVSELCAVGRGGILIPYPFAVDDHQTANAAFMIKANAAKMIPQSGLTAAKLSAELLKWIESKGQCKKMGEAALQLNNNHATASIISVCKQACS